MTKKTEEIAGVVVEEGATEPIYPPYSVRLPTDIRNDLKLIAKRQCRSLARQIIFALQEHVVMEKRKAPLD